MARIKGKRTLVATLSILVVLLVAIGTIALIRIAVNNGKDDTSNVSTNTPSSTDTSDEAVTDEATNTGASEETTPAESTIDPATVSTIDITSLGITVSYVKGIGPFSYEALRAANGTKYVEFRSEALVGTKCTNDEGTFASILVSPTEDEKGTLSTTTKVDDTEYGLSLADSTCTSDADALATYQTSFKDAFSLLKKL